MGSGGGTNTVSADPWSGLQPYLLGSPNAGVQPGNPLTGSLPATQTGGGRGEGGGGYGGVGGGSNYTIMPVGGTPGGATAIGQDGQAIPGLFPEAGRLYGEGPNTFFPGQTYAGFDPSQMSGQNQNLQYAGGQGAQLGNAAGNANMQMLNQLNPMANPMLAATLGTLPTSAGTVNTLQGGQAPNNAALARAMSGDVNPYLSPLVSAAQRSSMRGFEDTSQAAGRAFQDSIMPGLNDIQTANQDTVRQFQEEILPMIREQSIQAGGLDTSRGGLAQGVAAGRAADSLSRNLGRFGEASALSGGRTMQDILRNQSRASTDMGDIASQLYGGAFEGAQNRALSAGQTYGGMQSGALNRALSAAGLGLGSAQGAYGNALDALMRGQALTPSAQQAGLFSGQVQQQIGGQRQGQEQLGIDEQMARHDFGQNAPWQNLMNYAGILQPGFNLGGTSTTSGPGPNRATGALGGAASGAALGTAVAPGVGTGVGAGLGALLALMG